MYNSEYFILDSIIVVDWSIGIKYLLVHFDSLLLVVHILRIIFVLWSLVQLKIPKCVLET